MQIYELNEAGLLSRAYELSKRQARNYMSKKTGLPAGMFRSKEEAEKEDLQAAIQAEIAKRARQANAKLRATQVQNALGANPFDDEQNNEPVAPASTTTTTAATDANKTPEQIRIEKQKAAAALAQQQMSGQTANAPPAATVPKLSTTQINQAIAGIRTRDLQSIKKNIDTVLTNRQKTPAPGAGAMASMAGQLAAKPTATSTGGVARTTPTGVVHTAKPAAAVAPAVRPASDPVAAAANVMAKQKAKAKPTKVSAPPPSGAPTPAEYANLEKRLQQAMKAKGRVK